jgi:hypothetical protein
MTIREIGCCGAYCKTCMKQQTEKYPRERTCRGCKIGYESGERETSPNLNAKSKSAVSRKDNWRPAQTAQITGARYSRVFGIRKDGNTNNARNNSNSSDKTAIRSS